MEHHLSKTFESLSLAPPLLRALEALQFTEPTPIQERAIPPLLEGRDVLGVAQTGTGKTAAFGLPMLQHLAAKRPAGKRRIRALILAPTRELAAQIDDALGTFGAHLDLKHGVIFGGVNANPQIRMLERGLDIVVATPGRLLDLHGQGAIDFGGVEFFVLDEADRMLDMGFIHDIRRVVRLVPRDRQTLLFSATMPDAIAKLAGDLLRDPVRVEVTPQATTVERINQSVMFVQRDDKKRLLASLLDTGDVERAIVFTRTKHGANRLVQQLERAGFQAAAIHGNKSQNARVRELEGFKDGTIPVLVATDVASRGIDIDDVTHVFNYDLPNEPESYVHRIGRTARAGREGTAIAFCDETEGAYLRDIERTIGAPIPVVDSHPFHTDIKIPQGKAPARSQRSGGRGPGAQSSARRPEPARTERPAGDAPRRQRRRGGRRSTTGSAS
jgi:ATP-dependent RNA helicase RhlE